MDTGFRSKSSTEKATAKGTIRMARLDDAQAIALIYAPYCTDSVATFELQPPSSDEIATRLAKILKHHPWLVYEEEGEIVGYAYGGGHRDRPAYRFSADVSVYIKQGAHGKGIGRRLYTVLLNLLKLQGFYNAYAGITLPNDASVGLHRAMGFSEIAIYRKVGFKHGQWHDTQWWHLRLNEVNEDETPDETVSVHQVLKEHPDAI